MDDSTGFDGGGVPLLVSSDSRCSVTGVPAPPLKLTSNWQGCPSTQLAGANGSMTFGVLFAVHESVAALLPPTELLVTNKVAICVPLAADGGRQRTWMFCEAPGAIDSDGANVHCVCPEQFGVPAGVLVKANHPAPPLMTASLTINEPLPALNTRTGCVEGFPGTTGP